jgi:hypothetical protein
MCDHKFDLSGRKFAEKLVVVVKIFAVSGRCGTPIITFLNAQSSGHVAKERMSQQQSYSGHNNFIQYFLLQFT